jgi:hypothetical protein
MGNKEPEEFKKEIKKLIKVTEEPKEEEISERPEKEEKKSEEKQSELLTKIKNFLKKPRNIWFFLAIVLMLIELELLWIHSLSYFLPKGYLPYTENFNASKVNIFVEVSNTLNPFSEDLVTQNDYVVFDFEITNFEDNKLEIKYHYHFIAPNNTDWVRSGSMSLDQNETKNGIEVIQFKDLGLNAVEFEFNIYDAKTKGFIRNSLWHFSPQVISQTDAMELNYRRIYVVILILTLIPSTVIAVKNLRDLYLEK